MRGGTYRITEDTALIRSGKPVRLYGASITSGATAAKVSFRNGTAATDTLIYEGHGEPNLTVDATDIPAEGIFFPAGLFVDIDANATAVVCFAELVTG